MIHKAEGDNVPSLFFKNDYQDRGMMKWAGFFLSDHTSAIKKQKRDELAERPREKQLSEVKGEIIYEALFGYKPVVIQMSYLVEGELLPVIEGIIENADNGQIWLKKFKHEQAENYEVDDIRNIQIIENLKWRSNE